MPGGLSVVVLQLIVQVHLSNNLNFRYVHGPCRWTKLQPSETVFVSSTDQYLLSRKCILWDYLTPHPVQFKSGDADHPARRAKAPATPEKVFFFFFFYLIFYLILTWFGMTFRQVIWNFGIEEGLVRAIQALHNIWRGAVFLLPDTYSQCRTRLAAILSLAQRCVYTSRFVFFLKCT